MHIAYRLHSFDSTETNCFQAMRHCFIYASGLYTRQKDWCTADMRHTKSNESSEGPVALRPKFISF